MNKKHAFKLSIESIWTIYFIMLYSLSGVFRFNHYVATLLLLGTTIFFRRNGLKISGRQVNILHYYSVFAIWIICSFFWATESTNEQQTIILSVIEIVIMLLCLLSYVDSLEKLERILRIFINCTLMAALIYYLVSPISTWGTTAMGTSVGIWRNAAGYYFAFCSIYSFYLHLNQGKKKQDLIKGFLLLIAAIGTGSRKVFVHFALAILLYVLLQKDVKRRFRVGASVGIIAIILLAVGSNIPIFYQMYEGRLFSIFLSESSGDASTTTRAYMRLYALELFRQHPVIGAGVDGFRAWIAHNNAFLARYAINATYSHCNYTELLANSGIVGFIMFYFFPIKESIKNIRNFDDAFVKLGLITIIIFVTLDYGTISYYMRFYAFILAFGLLCFKYGESSNGR